MKSYRIQFSGVNMQEAMKQVEELRDVDFKQKNSLLLLTEEMFSMMDTVLKNREAGFEIAREGDVFSLGLTIEAAVSTEAREQYMSMSSDGKNQAYKGLKGKMLALFEVMAGENSKIPMALTSGMSVDCCGYSQMWQMSMYLNNLTKQQQELDWDGMEKSIIVSLADDVLIGVRDNKVDIVVKKKF